MPRFFSLALLSLLTVLANCGGSEEGSSDDDDAGDTVNTEKLIGTPFEGMTTGDDLPWSTFFCGQYRTE